MEENSYQVKVEGWERAAIPVKATTKGSIADKTCEESDFFSASVRFSSGLPPNDNSEEFPSLLCHPTFPMNGDEAVEHATASKEPIPLEPFKIGEKPKLFFKENETKLGLELKLLEKTIIRFGVSEWWSARGCWVRDKNGIVDISYGFRRKRKFSSDEFWVLIRLLPGEFWIFSRRGSKEGEEQSGGEVMRKLRKTEKKIYIFKIFII